MKRDNLGFKLKATKKGLEGNKNKLKSKTNWLDKSMNHGKKIF